MADPRRAHGRVVPPRGTPVRARSALLVCVASLLIAGCGGSKSSDGPVTTSKGTTGTALGRVDPSKSIVAVQGIYPDRKTKVTGVVYDAKQGLVLTANHAMENAPSIDVRLADGTLTHARPVARAQCHDLAVIKLFPRPTQLSSIRFADSDSVKIGDRVSTMTYLFQSTADVPALTRVMGDVAALNVKQSFEPLPPTGPFISHQTPLAAPASGSALLNKRNEMIGLNTGVDHPREPDTPGLEYALSSNYLQQRLGELKPGVGGALGGWESEHNDCHAQMQKMIGNGHMHDPNAPAAKSKPGS